MFERLYIIGNGFDLHHHLHTSFSDFRDNFVKQKHQTLWNALMQIYGEPAQTDCWWYEFENNLGKINFPALIRSYNGQALGQIKVGQFLKNILPSYFENWLRSIDCNVLTENELISPHDSLFFSFNYTLLFEKIYNVPKDQVWHIHNSISRDNEEPLIVGPDPTQQELIKSSSKYMGEFSSAYIDDINQELYKFSKKVENRIRIENDRFDQYKDIKHIISMGFSFNDIDLPYVKKIIEVNEDKEDIHFTIYWHSEKETEIFKLKLRRLGIVEDKMELIHW